MTSLVFTPWRRRLPATLRVTLTPRATRAGVRPSLRRASTTRQRLGRFLLSVVMGCSVASAWAVDVNTATSAELEAISGIGPRTAENIVRERERAGRFESVEDLSERVRGIGQKKVQGLQAAGLRIGEASAAPEVPASAAAKRAVPAKP